MIAGNVFTIPAQEAFLECLAEGVLERYGNNPLQLAEVLILLPNRRSCRLLIETFSRITENKAIMLPMIRPVAETDEEALSLAEMEEDSWSSEIIEPLLPAIARSRRQLLLADLIQEWQVETGSPLYSVRQSGALAYKLAQFLDEVQRSELDMENLSALVTGELAVHWQVTVDFFTILSVKWPAILRDLRLMDPVARQVALIRRLIQHWKETPPNTPIIMAGTMGSIPSTLALMQQVVQQPDGIIILAGLDQIMSNEEWEALPQIHPQYMLKRAIKALSYTRNIVTLWKNKSHQPMIFLFFSSLFQSYATPQPAEITPNISLIEAASLQEEARVITLLLRDGLQSPDKRSFFVTNDRLLADLVKTDLKRYGIEIDDSAGEPLLTTPIGIFMRLLLDFSITNYGIMEGITLLKHPYLRLDNEERSSHLQRVRYLEFTIRTHNLRGNMITVKSFLEQKKDKNNALIAFLDRFFAMLTPLHSHDRTKRSFNEWLKILLNIMDSLTLALSQEAIILFRTQLEQLHSSEFLTQPLRLVDFSSIMESLFFGVNLRKSYGQHPRIAIFTPLEARLLSADRMILGGLTLGCWPQEYVPEWMNHSMREEFGLPALDRLSGMAAHDFVACASKPEVFITYAHKHGGKTTTPSPWIQRLRALAQQWNFSLDKNAHWLDYARQSILPSADLAPLQRPAARPAVAARPLSFSITDVELLRKDPYSYYAKRILNLRVIEGFEEDSDSRDYGNLIHAILEQFLKKDGLHMHEPEQVLLDVAKDVFSKQPDQALAQRVWWPRFHQLTEWILRQLSQESEDIHSHIMEYSIRAEWTLEDSTLCLVGKADRIDIANNNVRIVDYKTGNLPTKSDIFAGYSPQLSLEAVIMAHQPKSLPAFEMTYWSLKGYGNKSTTLSIVGNDVEKLSNYAQSGFIELAKIFQHANTPYYATPDMEHMVSHNNYAMLGRAKEWQYHDYVNTGEHYAQN